MVDLQLVVRVSNVSICQQRRWVLKEMSFQCKVGQLTLVHGPTGAGKSTLLKAINGLYIPDRGQLCVMGTMIPGRRRRHARAVWRQTGTLLQDIALFETKTAQDNVALGLRVIGVDRSTAREHARAWLERLQLGSKTAAYPCHLSGGERQRVALARALAPAPRLLVLDEPISALDQKMASIVMAEIKALTEQGSTVIMVSHRVGEIFGLCHQHIELRDGRIWQIEQLNESSPALSVQEPFRRQERVDSPVRLVKRALETDPD
jgi:ABC-type sulfate/molybdate transport systems ATPase subunit